SDLNVRTQPSVNGIILGTILSGITVEVFTEEENGWLKIKYEDNYGYVNGHYIKKDEEVVPEIPDVPEIAKQIAYVYNLGAEKLNVRPQPNTAHAPIGTLVQGDMVTIVGEIGNWYEIEYENSIAFVSKDYITFEKPSETPDVPEIDKQIAYVYNLGALTLNVRPQPNTTQSPIGTLVEGDTVTIIGEIGNWYKIEYENSIGYVSKNYITLEKPSQHPDSNIDFELESHTGVVIDGVTMLNVREQATTNSKIIGTLTEQDEVMIIGAENNFYRINYNNGIGYVHKDYIGVKATSDLNGRVSYLTTQYNYSLTQFAQIQQNYTSGTINSITSYIDPSNRSNISYLLQYLRIDKFRSFNIAGLNQQLLNKGVLHNQAQTIYNAAKYYNIDPIFFISQSIHETNWGTSSLAKGITITEIADESKPIKNSSGTIIDDLKTSGIIKPDNKGHIKNEKDLVRWVVNGVGDSSGPCWTDSS
ncbi:MAG: SH3 domain-containing protein, partial [Turicibacter sp.]|nr:SH3 domain-containing protein [Turicibacter sp.]